MYAVTVYDCNLVGDDCSSCVGIRNSSSLECGWCSTADSTTCSIDAECSGSVTNPPLLIEGVQCPGQMITGFSPPSGPPSGGTVITITGSDLGVTIDDFDPPGGITVGGVACTPLAEGYEQGRRVRCRTGANLPEGAQEVVVSLLRSSGVNEESATESFMVVLPTVSSVEPEFGPSAGGSQLTIRGTGLDISNPGSVRVFLDGASGPECTLNFM